MYIIFDTETTGLPKDWKAKMTDLDNWPRIIELAFQVYDSDYKLVHSYVTLIKPDGWVVPTAKFWIDNGFSQERNMSDGIPMKDALEEFAKWHDQCEYMIAHNISYDYNVLGAELIRNKVRCQKRLTQICTKETTTDFCNLKGNYGKPKWPTMGELHMKLFNEEMEDAHKADVDVAYTAKCFFECVNRKIIIL
jgi:DNA polymerase III alpha subunit (gram-positive type)